MWVTYLQTPPCNQTTMTMREHKFRARERVCSFLVAQQRITQNRAQIRKSRRVGVTRVRDLKNISNINTLRAIVIHERRVGTVFGQRNSIITIIYHEWVKRAAAACVVNQSVVLARTMSILYVLTFERRLMQVSSNYFFLHRRVTTISLSTLLKFISGEVNCRWKQSKLMRMTAMHFKRRRSHFIPSTRTHTWQLTTKYNVNNYYHICQKQTPSNHIERLYLKPKKIRVLQFNDFWWQENFKLGNQKNYIPVQAGNYFWLCGNIRGVGSLGTDDTRELARRTHRSATDSAKDWQLARLGRPPRATGRMVGGACVGARGYVTQSHQVMRALHLIMCVSHHLCPSCAQPGKRQKNPWKNGSHWPARRDPDDTSRAPLCRGYVTWHTQDDDFLLFHSSTTTALS